MRQSIRPLFSAVSLLTATLTLNACIQDRDAADEQLSTQQQAIKGGVTDSTTSGIVGMYAISGRSGGVCSGTLIAPNLVLTAQHCVAQVSSSYVQCGRSGFGNKFSASNILITTETYLPQNPRAYYPGAEVFTPPGGNDMCGFDLALVILSDNVPADKATPIAPRLNTPPQTGEIYSAHGYGHIGDGTGTGTRRVINGRRILCEGTTCDPRTSVQATEFWGTEGTCQGDSGGGAIDAQGRVIGALSRGPDGCLASIYSSPARWADWVREIGAKAAQRGGYATPEWVLEGTRDTDNDTIIDLTDNCPQLENPDQLDTDNDGQGDACDRDIDNDGIINSEDNCPTISNPDQKDNDGDGDGNECDGDHDNDGIPTTEDNCPYVSNADQADSDNDGLGDQCDADDDGDGIEDLEDNCPYTPNPNQDDVCPNGDLPKNPNGQDLLIVSNNSQGTESGCMSAPGGSSPTPTGTLALLLTIGGVGLVRRRKR